MPGYFYPRSPCGERPGKVKVVEPGLAFLSTLSLRRATAPNQRSYHCNRISIHALLAESDIPWLQLPLQIFHFYPRSPCGERPPSITPTASRRNFYPRSPCGERRKPRRLKSRRCDFYPRSPCGERLLSRAFCSSGIKNFYPRSPCGERLTLIFQIP